MLAPTSKINSLASCYHAALMYTLIDRIPFVGFLPFLIEDNPRLFVHSLLAQQLDWTVKRINLSAIINHWSPK